MTSKEREAVIMLLGAAQGAVSNLEYYAKDYNSSEIECIAHNLKDAVDAFMKNKRKTKK